jgi:DNA-binding MarR family transcriptional regulator
MHIDNVVSAWVVGAYDALVGAAAEVGLDPRALAALTLVATHGGCSGEWLRRRVGLTQSGTVRLVDRLEAEGLVRRARAGGRGIALTVTPDAEELLARWHAARGRVVDELLAGCSAQQRSALAGALATSLEHHPRERAEADSACRTCDWPACGETCPVDRSVPAA